MKKPASKDKELEYEKAIAKLYQQTSAQGPSEAVDNAILQAARDEVDKHHMAASPNKGKWFIPVTMAAGLLVAVIAVQIYFSGQQAGQQEKIVEDKTQVQSVPNKPIISASGQSSPDKMLKSISELIENSETEQAQKQYEAFSVLFPDHQVDYEKYPKLKTLNAGR